MASKRNLRRQACTGKRRYESQLSALMAVARMTGKLATALGRHHFNAYACAFCRGFHIGHGNPDREHRGRRY